MTRVDPMIGPESIGRPARASTEDEDLGNKARRGRMVTTPRPQRNENVRNQASEPTGAPNWLLSNGAVPKRILQRNPIPWNSQISNMKTALWWSFLISFATAVHVCLGMLRILNARKLGSRSSNKMFSVWELLDIAEHWGTDCTHLRSGLEGLPEIAN